MILRRYIGKRLSEYYQQPSHMVVGSINNDKYLLDQVWLGKWQYQYLYSKYYNNHTYNNQGQWLTPVELFAPYYSQILANYIMTSSLAKQQQRIRIVELGGGHGTNAKHILQHLSSSSNDSTIIDSYTIVDSSPTLQQHQRQVLSKVNDTIMMKTPIQFVSADIMTLAENNNNSKEEEDTTTTSVFSHLFPKNDDEEDVMTFILGLEVLDNLPHDKVQAIYSKKINKHHKPSYLQGQVNLQQMTEEMVPMQDTLLQRIIPHYPLRIQQQDSSSSSNHPEVVQWIPSVACGFLYRLFHECQNQNWNVLFADFDYLPPPTLQNNSNKKQRKSIPALEEPLITCMKDQDHECYLTYLDNCDILYPTNFDALAQFVRNCSQNSKKVTVMKQAEFLQLHGPQQIEATTSLGYTPLLHDFSNCSILTVRNK